MTGDRLLTAALISALASTLAASMVVMTIATVHAASSPSCHSWKRHHHGDLWHHRLISHPNLIGHFLSVILAFLSLYHIRKILELILDLSVLTIFAVLLS